MNKLAIGFSLIVCITILLSCSKGEVYFKYSEIKDTKWNQDQDLFFELDSLEFTPDRWYTFSLEVANNTMYPYRNLAIGVEYNYTDTSLFRIYNLTLADEYGKWLGKGSATIYQTSFVLKDSINYKKKEELKSIKLKQQMGVAKLKGIEKVGIKLIQHREYYGIN